MLTFADILDHDTVELKDGRLLTVVQDPTPHTPHILAEIPGTASPAQVPYEDIIRVLDRVWLDDTLSMLGLSERHRAVITLFRDLEGGPLHPSIVRAFLGGTATEARDDLGALVDRGLAMCIPGVTAKVHPVDYWFATKLCLASAERFKTPA